MPRLTFPPALLALLAAACGGGDPDESRSGVPADEFANRIEEISVLRPEEEKAVPSRVGALAENEIPEEYRTGPSCRFHSGGRLVLHSAAPGAVARIDGRVAPLRITGPVGPSGGFFEAPGITFSVGRRPPPSAAASASNPDGAAAAAPGGGAGATIGGDRSKPIERITGSWACQA